MKAGIRKLLCIILCCGLPIFSEAQVGNITSNLNDTVCSGSTGLLTANGIVGSVTIWQYDIGSGFQNIPSSAGNSTQSFFMIPNNTCYRFIHGGGNDTSAVFCIVVDDPSNAGTISGGGAQCGVASGTLTVSGNNGNIIGWYFSTGGPFGSLGNNTNTQTFNVTQTTYFAFMVKNGTCPVDTVIDTISITPFSNAGILSPSNSAVCATSNTVSISTSGVTGTNLGWQSAPSSTGPWTSLGNTSTTYATSNLSSTTYYILIAKSGICPNDTSNVAVVNVDQPPVGGTLAGGVMFCGTPPVTGTLTLSGETGTVVKWEFNTGSGWNTSPCTGNTCSYNTSVNTVYRVEVDNGVCPSTYSNNDTIGVSNPSVAGTLSLTDDTLCAYMGGGSLSLAGSDGNNYQWQYTLNGGSTWNNLPVFTGPSASYSNLPAGTISFHCIVKNNFCASATSNSVTVIVNPSPSVTISNNDTLVTPGSVFNVVAVGSGNPTWSPVANVNPVNSFTTAVTVDAAMGFVITVDDGSGCVGTDTLYVGLLPPPPSEFIANALTPNKDGINDAFHVDNVTYYESSSLEIFNEYGQLIYTASPYKNDWEGTYNGARVPDGTYYYVLKIKDQGKDKEYKGFISVLGGQ